MIKHHPPQELLLDYASGAATDAMALAVACHVSWCPACQREVASLEALGGIFLEEQTDVALSPGVLERVMARLAIAAPTAKARDVLREGASSAIPGPLRRYVSASLAELPWRRIGFLFDEVRLPPSSSEAKVSLIRLKPGAAIPRHTHRGAELTMVLAGGFKDNGEAYGPGDFAARDASDQHQPVADADEACLCLVVLDAPVKLTGLFGRLINPFLRI